MSKPLDGVVILGCHRSGTSAFARLFVTKGFSAGDPSRLTGKSWENRRGFFERRDVRDLNDLVIHSTGCEWDRISRFDVENVPTAVRREFDVGAKNVVEELRRNRPFVVKEPRFSVTLDLWKPHLGTNVGYVVAVRHPCEVAWSLRRRNQLTRAHGRALWAYYTVRSLAAVRDQRWLPLFYDESVDDLSAWESITEVFQRFTESGSLVPMDYQEAAIEPSLRRQKRFFQHWEDQLTVLERSLWEKLKSGDYSAVLHDDPVAHALRALSAYEREAQDTHLERVVVALDNVRESLSLCGSGMQRIRGGTILGTGFREFQQEQD